MQGRDIRTGGGRLTVVGTGPGSVDHMTPAARSALEQADTIVGYGTYLDLIRDTFPDKELVTTGMTREVERCREAMDLAESGRHVALVSGGDPGIYAMAGLVLELAETRNSSLPIDIIPGIAALNACAARLGAPLMHDFAAVSLSDLLTPWEKITARLDAAAAADFVIVLYNPKSKRRTGHIEVARDIVLKYRPPETPVGIVTGAMRDHETVVITTLGQMLENEIGMQSCVIIGNTATRVWKHLMITPRGYGSKYALEEPEGPVP